MKRYLGFTVIELLVTMVIMGLLFSLGYANYRDFSRRQAVASAGRMVIADLRLAQSKALSGEKPCTGNLSTYNFVIGAGSYQIKAVCSGTGSNSVITKTQPLPSGILISSSLSPISFKVLGQGTNIPTTGASITLSQTGTANIQTITVSEGGEIK